MTGVDVIRRVVKPLLWLAALAPLGILLWRGLQGRLGTNPVETLTHWTGQAGLVLLLASLAVTPVRRLTGWNPIIRTRRLLGLFAFFYAVVHVAIYVVFDHFFDLAGIWEDVVERPYITAGALSLVLLVPLAATSTRGWIRRLGSRWQRLHRLVYAAAALAVLHFFWKDASKGDVAGPLLYAVVLLLLLALRIPALRRRRARA